MQAKGASIYTWSPTTNLNTTLGPQVVARPNESITYTVRGTGVDVCGDSTASASIYVRNVQVLSNEPTREALLGRTVQLSPNPTNGLVEITLNNELRGAVSVTLYSVNGVTVQREQFRKDTDEVRFPLNVQRFTPGMYVVEVEVGEFRVRKRILKY